MVPISGTASDVVGMDSATRFKNTVNDNRIVTPGGRIADNEDSIFGFLGDKKRNRIFC